MSVGDDFMDQVLLDECPPVSVALAFYSLCAFFPNSGDLSPRMIGFYRNGILKNMPGNFLLSPRDFSHEFDRWSSDKETYKLQPSIPLYELLPVARIILSIHGHFLYEHHEGLERIRKQLNINRAMAYGVSEYDLRRKSFPSVTELKDEPKELMEKFLHHTPFYQFFHTQVPYLISKKALSEHCFICAKPGHGKTTLLSNFAVQFLNDPTQPGLFILDPAGDWFEELRYRIDPSRLVVLDPETNPPPLNFFDFKNATVAEAQQSFMYLMSSLSGGLSEKQSAIVPYLLKLLRGVPNASLETLRLIVDEKVKQPTQSQFAAYIAALPSVDQGFFNNQFYNSSMNPTKEAISWKIYGAMGSDAFRQMFSANENSFDAHAAMRERKVVLARGSENTLGEFGLPIFMQYIVSQVFLASLARFRIPKHQRHQCYLLCDEASHIFNHQTTRILVECRKLGLSFFGATQLIEQIPTEVKAAIYGATSIKAAGNVSFSDANTLAREMRTTGDFIQRMETFEWAFYVADTKKAVKVEVRPGALERMPKQTVAMDKKPTPPQPSLTETSSLPHPPEPAAREQQLNESSRDTNLPLPVTLAGQAPITTATDFPEPIIKPGKDWD